MTERERVARAICARHCNTWHDMEAEDINGYLADADAALAAMDTRATAHREAAAIGRALLESGATSRKLWRMLDEGVSVEESERIQQRYRDALARRRST